MLKTFFQTINRRTSESRVFRILKNKYLLVSVFFIIWIVFFDSNNLINWYGDIQTVITQERQKTYYENAIQQTDERLKELSSNRDSLEKFAREQYLFHEADEELFIVERPR
ncbi:MAG: septum formation inhibitor [Bacteroidales bacterium]